MVQFEDQEVLLFDVEWFDPMSVSVKKFTLTYYILDNTIQVVDDSTKKCFLARIFYPGVTYSELVIGGSINIYNRLFHIVNYGDLGTRMFMETYKRKAFLVLQPGSFSSVGTVLSLLSKHKLYTLNFKSVVVKKSFENDYGIIKGYNILIETSTEAHKTPDVIYENLQNDIISAGISAYALTVIPKGEKEESSEERQSYFSNGTIPSAATFPKPIISEKKESISQVTLGLIKPHVLKEGNCGAMIQDIITAGFELQHLQLIRMDGRTVNEAFLVYKDVLPLYRETLEHLLEGPVMAIQIINNRESNENIVEKFRDFCGPYIAEVAQVLEPESLRGKYSWNDAKNAIHCTDLAEDGTLECRYFFNLLQDA